MPKRTPCQSTHFHLLVKAGLRRIRNRLGEPDKDGRRRPIPIKGSEFDIDLLIPAVSQSPDVSFLPGEIGLEISRWDRLAVNPETFETNVPGIFAGGDFVTGPRDVIRVIADGRKAALSIHTYLSGERLEKRPGYFTPVPEMKIEPDLEKIPRQKMSTLPVEERKSFDREVELGFSKEEAVREAQRCLQCHAFTVFDRTKCIPCHATGYDPEKKTYKEENVGCEACHGPGERHQDTMMGRDALEGGKIARENGLKACTRCHTAHIGKEEHMALARKGLLIYP